MNYNISKKDHHFNLFFVKILKKYSIKETEKDALICSASKPGKYCINFIHFKCVQFFNKISTSLLLKNCPFYPKTHIFMNKNQIDQYNIDPTIYYFVKPKFGFQSKNISYYKGKTPLILHKLQFPLIFQEEIQNLKKINNRRFDIRVHIIYIKMETSVKAFYYNDIIQRLAFNSDQKINSDNIFTNVSNYNKLSESIIPDYCNTNLLMTLQSANNTIIQKLNKEKLYRKLEILIVGYDIMVDNNDKHWILEINCTPSLSYGENIKKSIMTMMEEIFYIIINYDKTSQISTKKFMEIS